MKIVVASDSFAPKIDGVADTAGVIARTLTARGHRVRVLAPGPGPEQIDRYPVIRLASVPFPCYTELRVAWPVPPVRRLLRAEPPDAAVVLTLGPVGLATALALPAHTRLIHIYTTDMPRYLRAYRLTGLLRPLEALARRVCARAAITLCPTAVVRDELATRGYPRLRVWGRGVDTEIFRPERRSAWMRLRLTGGEPERPLVLYVGRLAREKRLLDLYEAARRLSGVRFALVGDGPERELLERRFASVPAVFTGYLRGETLAAAFAAADIFAFPSDTDTFGQVVLQALASGVPAIVPTGTAPAELVPHGIAGLHVPPRDPNALADAIDRLVHEPDQRIAMARAARTHAASYSWPALLDQLEAMLALTGPGDPPLVGPAALG